MTTHLLDTNQLLRLIIKDDLDQYEEVLSLANLQVEGKINLVFELQVFFELQWVLLKFYNQSKEDLIFAIESLLQMNVFEVPNLEVFCPALEIYKKHNLDLEDCYFIQIALQNNYIFTSFDKQAMKVYDEMVGLWRG